MKYYIIAGEASGDLHASNLIKAIREEDPQAEIRAWGGDLMEAAGAEVVKHYRDLAFMGFVEVVRNLRTILGNFKACKADILEFRPDALILVDYPGFNLRMAKWAKTVDLKVFYYISPQLWAWHSSRVHGIKANIDRMFVILPFEEEFYAEYDYDVDFVGHPLLDVVEDYQPNVDLREKYNWSDQKIIAVLPGSRRQEISRMLPDMLKMATHFPDYRFVVAGAPAIPDEFYQPFLKEAADNVQLVSGRTYDLLNEAHSALVTSGTATLETGLFGVPQIVCYRGSSLSYLIARRLVNVKYISLVNLVLDRPLLRELIQTEFQPKVLKKELEKLLTPEEQGRLRAGYEELQDKLGHAGAAKRTAQLMKTYLK
ncbi:lipid-A-disaccharide synthase [Flavilitoribacter nigricans]|uniref:Lipid-A-disaccharide synthase n=1 Tax=Flavilitoribacter nigricans (strain ATCC 23147 / DSM 23189 / NBRC 102662 / NCIMB 1420 / SS-2) TaxID=1122177 RepID=A0A2D0N8C5_FLAN2|nr:lipid-A-disaccharide synthase [Flavilitoribacter nigricans]PHN04646.1 lipid-A-disaccharide synthase [Flavilitoribacter nigricans DSM 23189 = NBRC 102662]